MNQRVEQDTERELARRDREKRTTWDKIFADPRVRGPVEEEEAQRVQKDPDWKEPTDEPNDTDRTQSVPDSRAVVVPHG